MNEIFWNSIFPAYLEAISTFIAAIAAIAALYYASKAYKKDRSETEQQINNVNKQLTLYSELVQLEKRKRKSNISPLFINAGGGSSGDKYEVKVKNEGEIAHNIYLKPIQLDRLNLLNFPKMNYALTNSVLSINFTKKDSKDTTQIYAIPMDIELHYENADGDKFKQRIHTVNNWGVIERQEDVIE